MLRIKQAPKGFSLIELLIVIAVLGVLIAIIYAGVKKAQLKAHDTAIRRDVAQMRWLAEQVYDTQAASYRFWSQHASIAGQASTLLEDVDKHSLAQNATTIRETQTKEFCISAPLRSDTALHYCVDATGVFKTVSQACVDQVVNGPALLCPTS